MYKQTWIMGRTKTSYSANDVDMPGHVPVRPLPPTNGYVHVETNWLWEEDLGDCLRTSSCPLLGATWHSSCLCIGWRSHEELGKTKHKRVGMTKWELCHLLWRVRGFTGQIDLRGTKKAIFMKGKSFSCFIEIDSFRRCNYVIQTRALWCHSPNCES